MTEDSGGHLFKRAVAVILDIFVVATLGALLAVPLAMGGNSRFLALLSPALGILGLAYFVLMEARDGQTLGKKALGIKVVKKNGADIGVVESLIRNVLRVIDGFFVYLVGAIVILITDGQRVGDLAANTVVREL